MTARPAPAEIARTLALSAERARQHQREAALWREAFTAGARHGWQQGWRAGYDTAEADEAACWQPIRAAVRARLTSGWQQRLAAAEAHARREGVAQWDRFIAAAHATPPRARTSVQRAVVGAGLTARGGQ